ncbi:MAG: hypothetical protein ACUVT8_01355 [Armatimonadota bacterium]
MLSAIAATSVIQANSPINIGSRLELFVDDYLIDKLEGGAEQKLNHPVRREVALMFDAPWEGDTSAYVTVFKDSDGFRMYYRGSRWKPKKQENICVALSKDGVTWTRPSLGIVEYKGSRDNNIVWTGLGAHAFAPFKDTNPNASPDERYKAVGPGSGSGRNDVLYGYVSPDGFHWKLIKKEPIITEGNFDSQNVAFWDPNRGEYVCYLRAFRHTWPDGYRDIMRSTSKDFRSWTKPEWLTYPQAPDEHFYTNAIICYFRAPHIYLGFPKRYVPDRKEHGGNGVSDGVFMSSRDGLTFHRWVEAFMRPGLDEANWLDRNVMAAWGILETAPGELSLYYLEHNYRPTHCVRRVTIRTDGFVSIHAGAIPGRMITKPFVFSGRELVINYSTSAAGGIRVELEDESGKPLKGFTLADCPPIYGDELEHVVKWTASSDLTRFAGKPVRLKFELVDADLYSMRFR